MSSRETEKWRGYENNEADHPKKRATKKSFYMRTDFLEEDFDFTDGKLPEKRILKNANHMTSKAHKIDGNLYSMKNTCAFDSVTQLFLKIIRKPALMETVRSWNTQFSQFVVQLFDSGNYNFRNFHWS